LFILERLSELILDRKHSLDRSNSPLTSEGIRIEAIVRPSRPNGSVAADIQVKIGLPPFD
jgi:hypothetical protein